LRKNRQLALNLDDAAVRPTRTAGILEHLLLDNSRSEPKFAADTTQLPGRVANTQSADWVAPLGREHVRQWQARRRAEAGSRGILPRGREGFQPSAGMRARFIRFCALASHLVELSQTVMHYLGAVFPGDPVSQPNQSPLNARESAGSPEPSREALHEGHRRVASIT
jgi:hypothetical protein